LQDLRNFCSYFGAEAWLAVRFHRTAWYFLSLDDLEEKESCYLISKEVAERKGLSFEDISQS